jgi:hypothetical protein
MGRFDKIQRPKQPLDVLQVGGPITLFKHTQALAINRLHERLREGLEDLSKGQIYRILGFAQICYGIFVKWTATYYNISLSMLAAECTAQLLSLGLYHIKLLIPTTRKKLDA